MNILLFVTSLLMILSLLTYARMDSFRLFLGMESEFERYMQSIERSYTNQVAIDWYKNTNAPKAKEANAPKKAANNKTSKSSSPRISFKIFIDDKLKNDQPQLYTQSVQWAKNLMTVLYKNHRFFKQAEDKNPYFLDQILDNLSRAVEKLPPDLRPKKTVDLSNLELDPEISEVFYLMLKGCLVEGATPKQQANEEANSSLIPLQDESDTSEGPSDEEFGEFSNEGYDSLYNYITLREAATIRVYLASKPVLEALFGQSSVADNIIQSRKALYQAVKNKSLTADEASQQFKSMFSSYANGSEELYLDFSVSLTNPSGYN